MKKIKTIKTAIIALGAALLLVSCNKDEVNRGSYVDALVTVKEDASGTCFLQVDDNTTVIPSNMTTNPFKKEIRAITTLYFDDAKIEDKASAKVVYLDTVLTKSLVPSVANNKEYYGNDPVEIFNDWFTVAEDGYVTLHFTANEVLSPLKSHWVNLVKGENPENPYELVFHHRLEGPKGPGFVKGIVSFNIREILPDTDESTPLTIKFESFSGPKSFTLKAKGNK
ncbi:MAG: NigD-like protein [Bacteroidales bacterium]|nr:NigD-like protein [Bacteroidales bacterium]